MSKKTKTPALVTRGLAGKTSTGNRRHPAADQSPKQRKKRALAAAKHEIAAGEKSFRSAAEHIAAAIALGATQTEAAHAVGKTQGWVSRLLAWRKSGYRQDGPFDDDNAKKLLVTNNPRDWLLVAEQLCRSAIDCEQWLAKVTPPLDERAQFLQKLTETEAALNRTLVAIATVLRPELAEAA